MLAVALQIADDHSTMFKTKTDSPIRLVESRLPGQPKYQRMIIARKAL
jgi:hypothetical protein